MSLGVSALAAEQAEPPAVGLLNRVVAAAERGDCNAVLPLVAKLKTMREFADVPALRLVTLHLSASCLHELKQPSAAYDDALAGSTLPDSDDYLWRLRLYYEVERKDWPAVVATIEALSNGRGATLNALPISNLYTIDTQLKRAKLAALRQRLLTVLAADSYWPDEPGATNEGFRYRNALALQEAGDTKAALDLVRGLTSPSLVVGLTLDPRFRAAFPAEYDIRATVERDLAAQRTAADRHPDAIGPLVRVADDLRLLGRPREALATLDTIRAKVMGNAPLVDRDEQAIWWWDQIARAHHADGDAPAAIAALRSGRALSEHGSTNVSLTINLANTQLVTGDPAAALATLAGFKTDDGSASPYGVMQMISVRGCARVRTGDQSGADTDLAYARAHEDDDPATATALLLCRGDQEGAAASLVARLANPERRARALEELSTFDEPSTRLPPDPIRAAWTAVGQRPDVQAAAEKAGGVRRFAIQRSGF